MEVFAVVPGGYGGDGSKLDTAPTVYPSVESLWGCAHKNPETIRKRRRIQRQRKVTIHYIDSVLYNDIPPGHHAMLYTLFGRKQC